MVGKTIGSVPFLNELHPSSGPSAGIAANGLFIYSFVNLPEPAIDPVLFHMTEVKRSETHLLI